MRCSERERVANAGAAWRATLAWLLLLLLPPVLPHAAHSQGTPTPAACVPAARSTTVDAALTDERDPPRLIHFETREGTWMSLDVSPDGTTIVFDLLGDLYTMPITGGRARPITQGPSWDQQPRFSPDGKRIAFISDRGGIANLWLVDRTGRAACQLSHVPHNQSDSPVSTPAWSPDGRTIIVSERWGAHASSKLLWDTVASRATFALKVRQPGTWIPAAYDVASGRRRWVGDTGATSARPALGGVFSPDGHSFVTAAQPHPYDFAGAPNYWQIDRVEVGTGARAPVMGPALDRSAVRPALSHGGNVLAYLSPSGSRYGVRLRDLQTLRERWLIEERIDWPRLLGDVAEPSRLDLAPGYAFTPDDKSLIVTYGGKIHRIDVATGRSRVIPFVVDVQREVAPMEVHQFRLADTAINTRSVMYPALSPDGAHVAFSALGRLWVMQLPAEGRPAGRPWRLTADSIGEGYPSWSPDGRWIAYSAWEEGQGGMLRRAWVRAPDSPPAPTERLSFDTAAYYGTVVTADGRNVLAVRAALPPERRTVPYNVRDLSTELSAALSLELVAGPEAGGRTRLVRALPYRATQGPDATSRVPTDQLYLTADATRIHLGLSSFGWDGSDRRTELAIADSSTDLKALSDVSGVFAPNGRRVMLTHHARLSEATRPTGSDTLNVEEAEQRSFGSAAGAARRWGRAYGPWISWSADGRRVLFVQGGSLVLGEVPDSGWTEFSQIDVPLPVPVDIPRGTVVLRGARLITMSRRPESGPESGPEIIPRGDLVVRDNRIVALGPQGTVPVPKGATVRDISGKTILPGYVDLHDHFTPPYGVHAGQWWGWLIRLAHGVTAVRDPFEYRDFGVSFQFREMERAGAVVGPRIFSSGGMIYFYERPVQSLADAQAVVYPNANYFGTETFKEYSFQPWPSRRLVAAAAGAAGLNATTHSDQLRAVVDGFTGVEHNLNHVLYDDVLTLIAHSGTTLTNTFLVTAAALSSVVPTGREPWAYSRMRRFVPPPVREQYSAMWLDYSRRSGQLDRGQYNALFRNAAGIAARGGKIGVGMHGEYPGIGLHYELWFLAEGGMPNHEILRSATIVGATAIGHAHDFGSLEVGKLADLQILDKNPLVDIHNTTSIRYVMKNGRLYQAHDLTEIWPRQKPLSPIYLQDTTFTSSAAAQH